jgi:2-polyprenyl-3-methyl-5-hydroxy-6-metoxy-1,4-benzoquinol methylase
VRAPNKLPQHECRPEVVERRHPPRAIADDPSPTGRLTLVDRRPGATARYDDIAEWYVPWIDTAPGFVCDPALGVITERLDGQRWLDVACGAGRTSRELARRGATVTGIDLSERMIAVAAADAEERPQLSYRVGDITRLAEWWDGAPFDGATCEMAFMDIDDLEGTIAAVATVLRPDARFGVSLVHPCFPGNAAGLSSWPPDGDYVTEGFWTSAAHNPDGIRIRVGSSHRTLATYVNLLLDGGFVLDRVHEPPAHVPTLLVLALHRSSGQR